MRVARQGRENRWRSRWAGAAAGIIPAATLTALFAVSGSLDSAADGVRTFAEFALWGGAVGWVVGPLAVGGGRTIRMAVPAFALVGLGIGAALAVVQAALDTIATHGIDPVAVIGAMVARGAYAVVSTLYLLGPALALGLLWWLGTRPLLERSVGVPGTAGTAAPRSRTSATRRWAIGFVTGLCVGVSVLVTGMLGAVLGILAILLLGIEPERAAPVGGLFIGWGIGWLAIFGTASARCGDGCTFPDLTPWIATSSARSRSAWS